ncbi:MAG: hypothetical protein IPK07_23995 [Deltaproteobacteria bacterium]|nr:hypothetical protein [Deltaproteobacteria bacterium]
MNRDEKSDLQELEATLRETMTPMEASRELHIRPPKTPRAAPSFPSVLCPGRDVMQAAEMFGACLAVLATGRIPIVEEPLA